jgi:hypothetical protein
MSENIFENSGALHIDCKGTGANVATFSATDQTCRSHTGMVQCTLDSYCTYDLSTGYQQTVKTSCSALHGKAEQCDGDLRCIYYENTGKCVPRSFCRAKSCEDIVMDVGISSFCKDLKLPDWCPAKPSNVEVAYKPFKASNVYLKNVERVSVNATSEKDCATQVALLGKDMFEYGTQCYWYNKIFDLQTNTGKTTFKLTGYSTTGLSAYKTQWGDQCFALSAEVTSVAVQANEKPSNLFFMCWNLYEKNYPFVMSSTGSPRGGIKLMHEKQFRKFVSSVGIAKQDKRWDPNLFRYNTDGIEVNANWCKSHINTRYPTGDMVSWMDATKTARNFKEERHATI